MGQVEVLKLLEENPHEWFTKREISGILKVANAHRPITVLLRNKEIVRRVRFTKAQKPSYEYQIK